MSVILRPSAKALQETDGGYLSINRIVRFHYSGTSENKSVARGNDVYQTDQQKLAWVLGVN